MSNHIRQDARTPSPPPAPPLPSERHGFVANALARVAQPFGYGSRPTSATGHRPSNPRSSRLSVERSSRWAPMPSQPSLLKFPKVPQVPQGSSEAQADVDGSPISSKSVSHKTGIPIAALDISPDRSHAVLAGHNILKTIQVSETACAEDINLRTSIIAYAATHESLGTTTAFTHREQWTANDVKWSHGQYSTTIATAAANGQIVVYDINRRGLETARLHEHSRQVHRLAFSPYQGQLMLSGSQDGTIRLWDLRDLSEDRSVTTCHSRRKYMGNSEGIRDLKWSPMDGFQFALGTDNGVIQRWDIRNEKTPLLRVSAHEHKTCYSIDWHPDGKHLVSAGADKNIKVWDFSSSDRRKKHVWEIRAPQAVLNVRWRPACWSSGKQKSAKWQCTQIATSYDQQDPRIHIWDFRRPHLPFHTIARYDTPASALLWHSENRLWSVGSAGIFTQTDISFVPKTMDHLSPNTLTIAADSQILFFSQKRERRRASIESVLVDLNHQSHPQANTSERARDSSRVQEDNAAAPSLLGSSYKIRPRKTTGSTRSTMSSTGTPPSGTPTGPVEDLEESLQSHNMHQSSQVAGIGYIEGLFDAPAFRYLARNYKMPLIPKADSKCSLHTILGDALRQNSILAAHTGQYRLAQSLQILALATEKELEARAVQRLQCRKQAATPEEKSFKRASLRSTATENPTENSNFQGPGLGHGQLQVKDLASSVNENTSNMTTPLARPISDSVAALTVTSTVESLQLPNTTWNKQPVKPNVGVSEIARMTSPKSSGKDTSLSQTRQAISESSSGHESLPQQRSNELQEDDSLANVDRHMAERRAATNNYKATPRPLLRLDDPIDMGTSGLSVPSFDRQDSDESFQLFSASTDSSHRAQSIVGSFESTQNSQKSTSSPEHMNTIDESTNRSTQRHEEDTFVFDDEAQLLSPGQPSASSSSAPKSARGMESSRTAEEAGSAKSYRPSHPQVPIIHQEDFEEWHRQAEPLLEHEIDEASDKSHEYLLSDYIPPEQKPDDLRPWFASSLFEPLVDFHTYKLYDAQLPTWLLLHLGRWVHHSIPYERAMLIFLQYHRQLIDLGCVVQAAELRKLAGPEFPEVAEYGLYGITPGGPWCTGCQKPNKGNKPGFCERCSERWADCPICNGTGPISAPDADGVCRKTDNAGANGLWTWCQDCGHGGHMACLSIFWEMDDGEGACPTIGCLHDCMPGKRRDEIVAKLEKEREEKKPGVVSKDEWKVPESAAAQRARALMGPVGGLGIGGGSGRGALGLAAAGRSGSGGSGGKKVRIVVPEDEDGLEEGEGKGKGVETTSTSAP